MKFCVIACLFLCFHTSFSQSFTLSDYTQTNFQIIIQRPVSSNVFHTEVTPWVVKGGWYQYIFTTHFSAMWSTTESIATPYNQTITVGSGNSYGPYWILASLHWWGGMRSPALLNDPNYVYHQQWMNHHWRRNYNGIFSAHVYDHIPSSQKILFSVSHGENKNERVGDYCYQNSINPTQPIICNDPNTWSGSIDGINYREHWQSYAGFLNGNWIPYTLANDWGNIYHNDLGPIGWPSAGYLDQNSLQTSNGLRHPSSIIEGNHIYIFVKDESFDNTSGVKLFRCELDSTLTPARFETWAGSNWIPALPAGFHKDQIANFFSTRGPQNTPVFSPQYNTVRFAVAKFKNSNEFIGVEQYNASANSIRIALRTSSDLIHWSSPIDIYTTSNWSDLPYKYPIFLSKDGTSNTSIDRDEFYIVGVDKITSTTSQKIAKIRFVQQANTAGTLFHIKKKLSALSTIAFPNPFSTNLSLEIRNSEIGKYDIAVYSPYGKLILKKEKTMMGNPSEYINLNLNGKPAGIYFVVISKKGIVFERLKVTKY